MRILHLPTSTGGNSWSLAQGEKSLGLDSTVLYTSSNWLNYSSDINLHLEEIQFNYLKLLNMLKAFVKIRGQYEVFHFNFGQSIVHAPKYMLNNVDLPFYPKKAKLFVTYNGCDARQKLPTMARTTISACHYAECYDGICNSGRGDKLKRRSIAKMARYVRHIWALNPDLLYFLPKDKASFLPYSVALDDIDPAIPDSSNKKIRIAHAPTNRACKGSDIILDALNSLKKTHGHLIDICLVENLSHKQAVQTYKQADLVIDQILVGWYGALAIEVMSIGKPVICRIEQDDLHFLPKQMAEDVTKAFIPAEPGTIRDAIVLCIEDRQFLKEKAEAGLEYARKWHDPRYVAGITKEMYER